MSRDVLLTVSVRVIDPFPVESDLVETDTNSNLMHGVMILFLVWSSYAVLLIYSPLVHSWHGYTHDPLENVTTYIPSNRGNAQL